MCLIVWDISVTNMQKMYALLQKNTQNTHIHITFIVKYMHIYIKIRQSSAQTHYEGKTHTKK